MVTCNRSSLCSLCWCSAQLHALTGCIELITESHGRWPDVICQARDILHERSILGCLKRPKIEPSLAVCHFPKAETPDSQEMTRPKKSTRPLGTVVSARYVAGRITKVSRNSLTRTAPCGPSLHPSISLEQTSSSHFAKRTVGVSASLLTKSAAQNTKGHRMQAPSSHCTKKPICVFLPPKGAVINAR